jgi:hypothetical protein
MSKPRSVLTKWRGLRADKAAPDVEGARVAGMLARDRAEAETTDQVQGPAIITADHVQTRYVSTRAGSKQAWERLSVFEKAHRSGKLMDKDLCIGKTKAEVEEATKIEAQKALDRYDAGDRFVEGWKIAKEGSWPCGADMNRVRVLGCPGSFADHQIDVKNFMRALEKRLSTRDWMILRRVCGENCPIAETVTAITPGYRASTLARFRESLDALVEASPLAHRDAKR